jgi:putative transposase
MPNYRRPRVPGATWFFTVNLADRRRRLLVERVNELRAAVRYTQHRFPFHIDAMVILPDHIHAVWTLPDGDLDFPVRWRLIKAHFSRAMPKSEPLSESRQRRGERGIWQRRYWEHSIGDERDFGHHIDYCWFNPVKHGLVSRVEDWPFSSYHRDMRTSQYLDKEAAPRELARIVRHGE